MKIKVVTITGKEIEIEDIEPAHTVYQIKEKFQAKEGIPTRQQKYIARGKLLNDSDTVKELEMREGFKIHLILHKCLSHCMRA